jgi:hypothetical protein
MQEFVGEGLINVFTTAKYDLKQTPKLTALLYEGYSESKYRFAVKKID